MNQHMQLTINKRKTIIFDFDGTLSNHTYDVTPIVFDLFYDISCGRISKERIKRDMAHPGYATAISKLFPFEEQEKVYQLVVELSIEQVKAGQLAVPNLKVMLESLIENYNLSIFSARDPVSLELAVRELGITGYFNAIEGHSGSYAPKPNPSGFLAFLKRHSIPLDMAIYVGDKEVDKKMANAANVLFIGAGWLRNHLMPTDCEHFCVEFADLAKTLFSLK